MGFIEDIYADRKVSEEREKAERAEERQRVCQVPACPVDRRHVHRDW